MPWPFSRNEPESADRDAGEGDGRRGVTRDPAAELRSQTRRRLVGAAALLLAAVIVLPMLLDTAPRPVREDIAITVASPPPPAPKPPDSAPVPEDRIAEPAPVHGEAPTVDPPAAARATPAPPPPPPAAPAARAKPPAAPAAAVERFAVQVAALSSAPAAMDLAARLAKGGFGAYVEAVSTADGTLHRVRVGPFASREEAQRTADRMKAAGHKATVVGG